MNYSSTSIDIIKNTDIINIYETLTNFTTFIQNINRNTITQSPLKIYKPLAPPGYISLGHIFCNIQDQLKNIKEIDILGNGVCCIPEQCTKAMRDWAISDKVFEYKNNNVYWAIYVNPFTGTFISTNNNKLPDGKVYKVVACVKKCNTIKKLSQTDECARNYYNLNKKIKNEVNVSPNLVADQEELFYLDKLKAQSDSISRLSSKAQTMQLGLDKANIVNKEMNKRKLQTYVDTQKRNIDIVTDRLIKDKNNIQTNINLPIDTLNKLITMIKTSKDIAPEAKVQLVSKLINNKSMLDSNLISKTEYEDALNQVLSSCPTYDLTGLVKKSLVSDVCYGCSTP